MKRNTSEVVLTLRNGVVLCRIHDTDGKLSYGIIPVKEVHASVVMSAREWSLFADAIRSDQLSEDLEERPGEEQ